jgi:hypothetical protein
MVSMDMYDNNFARFVCGCETYFCFVRRMSSYTNKVCMIKYGPEKGAVNEQCRILLDK